MNKYLVFEWVIIYIDVGFVLRDWFKYINMSLWNIMFINKNTCFFGIERCKILLIFC